MQYKMILIRCMTLDLSFETEETFQTLSKCTFFYMSVIWCNFKNYSNLVHYICIKKLYMYVYNLSYFPAPLLEFYLIRKISKI